MPLYRVIKPIPESVAYRDGKLIFTDYYRGGKDWVWYCRREIVSHRAIDLCVAEGADGLEALRRSGIAVPKGSTADAVMRSLMRKGLVERVAE